MSKEQQELLDEAYENYCKITPSEQVIGSDLNPLKNSMTWKRKTDYSSGYPIYERLTKEEFIDKCKTNPEFSQRWGLKIEEQIVLEQVEQNNPVLKGSTALYSTKLITITYNDKIIESYE